MTERLKIDITASIKAKDNLKLLEPIPLNRHPAAVYLSNLVQGSNRQWNKTLDAIASVFTCGECDHLSLDWAKIRYHHTSSVRSVLRQQYVPATANKMLSALKRVLKEAYRLDLLGADDYTKAVDLRYSRHRHCYPSLESALQDLEAGITAYLDENGI